MDEGKMVSEAAKLGNERRQFARNVLPMTINIEGAQFKGLDLSLGGLRMVDVRGPYTDGTMARISVNRRDVRIDFVAEVAPVKYDPTQRQQSFRFLGLTTMQASIISLLMHPQEH